MIYKFEITYIPPFLIKINEQLSECFSENVQSALVTTLRLAHNEDYGINIVKKNIIWAFEYEGCKVIKIEGGKIE